MPILKNVLLFRIAFARGRPLSQEVLAEEGILMEKSYQKARKRFSAGSNEGAAGSGPGSFDDSSGEGFPKKVGGHVRRKSSRRQGRKGSFKRRKSGLAFLSGITPYSNMLTAHAHGQGRALFSQYGYGMPSDELERSASTAK